MNLSPIFFRSLAPRVQRELAQPKKKEIARTGHTKADGVADVEQISSALFFEYNAKLGPPYRILLDTNIINFSIQNKIDIFKGMMDCLMAKCIPMITDCVIGELEKMGHRYTLALRIAKDPRIKRLTCNHRGTYADDCLVTRVTQHRCYVVATADKDLKRRIRKIPGVPIISIVRHQFDVENMPDAPNRVSFGNAKIKAGISG